MTYYKLLDAKHKDMVVKANGSEQYLYVQGQGWVRSAIMLHYFSDESDTYDEFEEINKSEAEMLTGEKS